MTPKEVKERSVIEFIECYRSLSSLWDKSDPGYSSSVQRNIDYQVLLQKHKETNPCDGLDELKAKIRNLRTCYAREQRRLEKLRESDPAFEERQNFTKLFYYDVMSFLNEQQEVKESTKISLDDSKDSNVILVNPANMQDTSSSKKRKTESKTSPISELAVHILNKIAEKPDHTKTHMILCADELNECDPAERLAAREVISNVVLKAKLKMLARAEYYNFKMPEYLRIHDE